VIKPGLLTKASAYPPATVPHGAAALLSNCSPSATRLAPRRDLF